MSTEQAVQTFVRSLKEIGLSEGRRMIDLMETWEGLQVNPPKQNVSKRTLAMAEDLGEQVMALMPKKPGRQADPNSAMQKVHTAIREYLGKVKAAPLSALWAHLPTATGLPLATCKINAYSLKGVVRSYGNWSIPIEGR